ncbi:MAG: hypothetical protein RR275_00535 [Lachnospiraceae bacterium]
MNLNKYNLINRLFQGLRKIKIADKFLIIIMLILMLQSMYGIFFHNHFNEITTSIDVVVRTTIAGIFGYFISVNFIKNEAVEEPREYKESQESQESQNMNAQNLTGKERIPRSFLCSSAYKAQILIVGSICILSLLILLTARNFSNLDHTTMPIIIQLRDLISGSVGFFIGMPNENQRKNC